MWGSGFRVENWGLGFRVKGWGLVRTSRRATTTRTLVRVSVVRLAGPANTARTPKTPGERGHRISGLGFRV